MAAQTTDIHMNLLLQCNLEQWTMDTNMVSRVYAGRRGSSFRTPCFAQNQGHLASWQCIWGLSLCKLQAVSHHPVSPISSNPVPHPLRPSLTCHCCRVSPPHSTTRSPLCSSTFLTSPLDIVPCSGTENCSHIFCCFCCLFFACLGFVSGFLVLGVFSANSFTSKNNHCHELLGQSSVRSKVFDL